jgi:hypothetical protein
MKRCILVSLILASQPSLAAPKALSPDQRDRVRCVAALAIVAHDQGRGVAIWGDVPPLQKRGAHFAGTVGQSLMDRNALSKEAVRTLFIDGVAHFQKSKLTTETVSHCFTRMNEIDAPALTDCAAMLSLAYDDKRLREGLSADSKSLATYAAVLDGRARDELHKAGRTDAEADIIIGKARERYAASLADQVAKGEEPDLPLDACFELARP